MKFDPLVTQFEEALAAAQAQSRHKSPETTMRYDAAPVATVGTL